MPAACCLETPCLSHLNSFTHPLQNQNQTPGQDLVDKGGSSDEELLAKIAYNVLRGLHYLHAQGKIHRDVKPGNLLINSKNFVKIADCAFSLVLVLVLVSFCRWVGWMGDGLKISSHIEPTTRSMAQSGWRRAWTR